MASSDPAPPDAALPDRYAVLGHPVGHSQSPFIHAEFARQTGERIEYGRVELPRDGFAAGVRRFAASGDPAAGRGPARGCNVTVPFKFEVPALAARVSARAALAQAANVLSFERDGWYADNTDGIGLVRDIQGSAATPLAGLRLLLIGAGGAAAGVLGPLIEARPRAIEVVNRTPAYAARLVHRHAELARRHGVALSSAGLDACGTAYDVVVNASSSSLAGSGVPVAAHVLAPGALAVDLMYGPQAAVFLAWATAHGARGRDGLGMLVEQAAEAFHVWRGVMPRTAPVLDALRARLAEQP